MNLTGLLIYAAITLLVWWAMQRQIENNADAGHGAGH